MCEYGFIQEVDFIPFLEESTGGRPSQDHQLTIEMAKEISMLQRNEKGKQARQYFIQLEKNWNSPEIVMARALKLADSKNVKECLESTLIFCNNIFTPTQYISALSMIRSKRYIPTNS